MTDRPTYADSPKCVVSGSFRQHYDRILQVREALSRAGAWVLSPADSQVVDPRQEFVLLDSDLDRWQDPEIRHIEDAVLEGIRGSDFLYVCNPEGYVGQSTAFEIGYAAALGRRVVALCPPTDPMILRYVDHVAGPAQAVALLYPQLGAREPLREGSREEEPMLEHPLSHHPPAGQR